MRFLASIVLDESRSAEIRLAAYCSLFEVSARDLWTLPDANIFRVPDDFDLQFLRKCVGG